MAMPKATDSRNETFMTVHASMRAIARSTRRGASLWFDVGACCSLMGFLPAKDGGVLERNGHTEATVDLLLLAGLKPCGICCEVMDDDGTMMRTPKLKKLAQKHDLKFISIKALQDYRKKHDILVKKVDAMIMYKRFFSI